jgi:peptide/nickel transport system substrate-binding protein
VVSADAAVTQIEAGAIDIYGSNLSTPQDLEAIEAAGLETSFQYGIYYELTFNPAGDPTFANDPEKLNPFSSARVREAMQMLVDRDYINQEIYGGNAVPKFVSFVSGFPEYGKYIDLIRPYEVKYAPNREKVVEIVTEEMEAMGATMVDGKWTYNDAPVEITFLIRSMVPLPNCPLCGSTATLKTVCGTSTPAPGAPAWFPAMTPTTSNSSSHRAPSTVGPLCGSPMPRT